MFKATNAFSGFSVSDLAAAKQFYGHTLCINIEESQQGIVLKLAGGNDVFIYAKDNHVPAEFTILNFRVEDIDQAVDDLQNLGVTLERYNNMPAAQDEKGIARGRAANMGPDIAWFKDPAGNVLAVLQEK